MNYYQTSSYIASTASYNPNHKPNTLLPYLAYNDYEQQVKETFINCINSKQSLNEILYSTIEQIHSSEDEDYMIASQSSGSFDSEGNPCSSCEEEEISCSDIEEEVVSSLELLVSQPGPSIAPLPPLAPFDSDTATGHDTDAANPVIQLLFSHLEAESTDRDDFNDFISYIESTYDIDLAQPLDDLPFPVIDEILTYIDYDPDDDDDLFDCSDCSDIIIPRAQVTEFQNSFNSFTFNVKMLQHLDSMNCITNDRTDDAYYTFQTIFKPSLYPLLKLYHHDINKFQLILSNTMNYYISQDQ